MSLTTTNRVPVSLPSLSKLTGSFSPSLFSTALTNDLRKNDSLPGLPELRFEHNGYQKNAQSIHHQSYPTEHTIVDSNQHSRYQQEGSLSPPPSDANRRASAPTLQNQDEISTSDRILLEKRKRNANASARFRDRRKQRERELQEKYRALEKRSKEFEYALKQINPNHPLITEHSATEPQQNDTLFQRVDQLESLMQRFHHEKETSSQRLRELEEENKYLKSLIVPISNHS